MDPTQAYAKAKRALLIFDGALLLAVFAGFKIVAGDQKITVLPFQIERPDLLPLILAIVVGFCMFQYGLQWAAQGPDIQQNRFYRYDFFSIMLVSFLAVACYIGSLVLQYIPASAFSRTVLYIALGLIALSTLLSFLILKAATRLGQVLRRLETRDQKLSRTLRSKEWILIHNPDDPKAKKTVTFVRGGSVGLGRNENENTWKIRNGTLEFHNIDGRVFSVFTQDQAGESFSQIKSGETRFRKQLMYPKTSADNGVP